MHLIFDLQNPESDEKFSIIFVGSINRASCIDELRQSQSGHYTGKSSRSVADGQSQHSFSNNSSRYFGNATLTSNLINTRPGLSLSFNSPSLKAKITEKSS